MDVASELTLLVAAKLVVYSLGALLHLFLMVLILGQRRLRRLEWLLFALMAALFWVVLRGHDPHEVAEALLRASIVGVAAGAALATGIYIFLGNARSHIESVGKAASGIGWPNEIVAVFMKPLQASQTISSSAFQRGCKCSIS